MIIQSMICCTLYSTNPNCKCKIIDSIPLLLMKWETGFSSLWEMNKMLFLGRAQAPLKKLSNFVSFADAGFL